MNKEKLTMIELFSGIGAQIRGIENTNLWDCTVVNTSDIDKDAMVSYAAIHCGLTPELIDTYEDYPSRDEMAKVLTERNIGFDFKKNAPYDWYKLAKRKGNEINKYYLACILSKNLGDISSIKNLDYADFWTYSFPCFVEGTLVLTADGYKPIETVTSDDYVLTHNNTYQKVVKPMINQTDKIYKVDTMVSEAIFTTENHPFYVRKKHNCQDSKTGKRYRIFDEPEWVEARRRVYSPEGICPTLNGIGQGGNTEPKIIVVGRLDIKGKDQIRRVYDPDGLAPTLSTMQGGNSNQKS